MAEIHDRSTAQEKRLASTVGGQRSSRSGAGWLRKSDVRSERFLYEAKSTASKKSITLNEEMFRKNRQHAYVQGRVPVLAFELAGRRYVVVDEATWIEESGGG